MKKICCILLIYILGGVAIGQRSQTMIVRDKPVLTLEGQLSKYYNLQQPDDSLQSRNPIEYDHLKAISQGLRYDFSALLHIGEYFELGPTFTGLQTAHTVQDVTMIIFTPQGDTITLSGNLTDKIRQSYFGLRLDSRIAISENLYVRPGISLGYLQYRQSTDAAGYKYHLVGSTFAVDIHTTLQYKADDNWSLMLAASLMPTFIYEPVLEYDTGGAFVVTGGTLNVGHVKIGAGLSYTFTQPNKTRMPPYFRAR